MLRGELVMDSRVVTVSLDELEELIRRVIREELERSETGRVMYLEDDSLLYQDMIELKRQKETGELQILPLDKVLHGEE